MVAETKTDCLQKLHCSFVLNSNPKNISCTETMAASKEANLNTDEAIPLYLLTKIQIVKIIVRKKKSQKKVLIMTKIHLMKITMTMKYQYLSPVQECK